MRSYRDIDPSCYLIETMEIDKAEEQEDVKENGEEMKIDLEEEP